MSREDSCPSCGCQVPELAAYQEAERERSRVLLIQDIVAESMRAGTAEAELRECSAELVGVQARLAEAERLLKWASTECEPATSDFPEAAIAFLPTPTPPPAPEPARDVNGWKVDPDENCCPECDSPPERDAEPTLLERIEEKLAATRWMPDGSIEAWGKTRDGMNCALVNDALEILRSARGAR